MVAYKYCAVRNVALGLAQLEFECASGVDVADGDGEGVGGVGGLGRFGEVEQAGDHELDLFLLREAVADDGGLDGERGVLGDGEVLIGGGQQGHAAHLAELEGALGVGAEKNLFDGDHVGAVGFEKRSELCVDLREATRGGLLLVEADGTEGEGVEARLAGLVVGMDHAVASELGAAVDAEDLHGRVPFR